MENLAISRVSGALSLLVVLFGGVAINCDICPDPHPTDAPHPDTPAPGTSHPVTGCSDADRYRSFTSLHMPDECDGTDSAGNPVTFGPGEELEIKPKILRKCPDENRSFAANEPFQVYWTICNVSDNVPNPASLQSYQLEIRRSQGGTETLDHAINLTQPANLDACGCVDQIVTFNSSDPDPAKHLVGSNTFSYVFRLTGLYSSTTKEQALVSP